MNEIQSKEPKSKAALVVVWSLVHLKELNRLVRLLHHSSEYHPSIMLGDQKSATEEAEQEWANAGIHWFAFWDQQRSLGRKVLRGVLLGLALLILVVCSPLILPVFLVGWIGQRFCGAPRQQASSLGGAKPQKPLAQRVVDILRHIPILMVPVAWRNMRNQIRLTRKVMRRYRPDVVVLPEDNPSFPTGVFVKVAHEFGIPAVVIPYTLASVEEFVEGYRNNTLHSTVKPLNRWIAGRFPHWCYEMEGKKFLRLPGPQVLMQEWFGIAPADPWIPNNGHWDGFAVESPRMLKRYRDEFHLPEAKLFSTGAVTDDLLSATKQQSAEIRKVLYTELSLSPELPMLLFALPPDQFTGERSGLEYSSYLELVEFLAKSIEDIPGYNSVISLHPRTPGSIHDFISSLGVKVSLRDTLQLVPLCDLYLASVSATIRWAVVCGIPVINYDIFQYHYTDYEEADGVVTVYNASDYQTALNNYTRNASYREELRNRQRNCAGKWGHGDGQSWNRILGMIARTRQLRANIAASGTGKSASAACRWIGKAA